MDNQEKKCFSNVASENRLAIVVITAFLGALWMVALGVRSDLYLGDETFHYRLAKAIYESESRPLIDPLTNFTKEGKIYYICGQLWHTILAASWKLLGGCTRTVAQIYHAMYYVILVFSTYLLARELYDKRRAMYAALLVSTVPMVVALTIIFHVDVPIAALTALCLLMLVRKQYLLTGVILGLGFLTKRNIYLLVPSIFLIIVYYSNRDVKKVVVRSLTLAIPLILMTAPDFYFRYSNFGKPIPMPGNLETESKPLYAFGGDILFYDIGHLIANPASIARSFGVVLLISIGAYLVYRRYSRKDIFLGIPILSYIVLAFYFSGGDLLDRYLSPILAPLAIIGAIGFSSLRSKYLRYILIAGCILQFVSASIFTYVHRRIPSGTMQGYAFIRKNAPVDSHILCCRNALAFHANRIAVWNSYASMAEMPYMFWEADANQIEQILRKYELDYIFVEKDRIYDDSTAQHLHGYPQSFTRKMSSLQLFDLVLENSDVSIWKIKKQR